MFLMECDNHISFFTTKFNLSKPFHSLNPVGRVYDKVKNTVGPWSITETILVKVRFEARN